MSSDRIQIRVWTESVRKKIFFFEKSSDSVQTIICNESELGKFRRNTDIRLNCQSSEVWTKSVLVQTVVTSGPNVTVTLSKKVLIQLLHISIRSLCNYYTFWKGLNETVTLFEKELM